MKKILITIPFALLLLLVSAYGLFQLSKSRTFQFFGGLTSRVETTEKVIALTFDDAPTSYSNEVIQILKDKNIKATFYVTGINIEKYPNEAQAIVNAGHEIGNHSYSHQRFLLKSQDYIDNEISKTNNLIRELGYTNEINFRPPNGKKLIGLPWYLSQHNIKTIMWDIEPDTFIQSYNASTSEFITQYTLDNIQPGSIILMHPFCEFECKYDREALPIIIESLKTQGYRFVTINELLTYKNN